MNHMGSQKVAVNGFYIFGILSFVLAIVFGLVALNYYTKAEGLNAEMKNQLAMEATGPCGNSQIVVVDKDVIAVAGDIYPAGEASKFTFREEAVEVGSRQMLVVRNEEGRILMKRPFDRR